MLKLPMQELLIATHNHGKLREFQTLCQKFGIKVHSAAQLGLPAPDETGTTFEENACLKATLAAQASGMVTLSDDSGLCIDALNGRPGVYSADWAIQKDGSRNFSVAMARVETELRHIGALTAETRTCRFVCVLCLAWPDGMTQYFRGEVCGHIHYPPSGTDGFGYDPIFMPCGFDKTFGQMSAQEKNGIDEKGQSLSHRARALQIFTQTMLEA